MGFARQFAQQHPQGVGAEAHSLAAEMYPICRSITGSGVRETLGIIGKRIPLQLTTISTGTAVFDWTIPNEWNIEDAYIKDGTGRKIVDFRDSNLHVVSYSAPIHRKLPLSELKQHLHSIPDYPDWIPYRTSYYREDWGFCLPHRLLESLQEGEYEACIESSLQPGQLTYGECLLPGRSSEEVLVSAHICHPSLANDNLSGIVVACALADFLAKYDHHYSYRFVFAPGTIGAIAWLAQNRDSAHRIRHGLVLTGVGNSAEFHYKRSRRGNAEVDVAMEHVLKHHSESSQVKNFTPYGYDERQYCSPGFNLPVGCLMRSEWGTFPEYHTSADNLGFIHPDRLNDAVKVCLSLFDVFEGNRRYRNLSPYCEPQLGKRDLYRSTGGEAIAPTVNALLWVLNFSDGEHSLLDIAELSGLNFEAISDAADVLTERQLLAAG